MASERLPRRDPRTVAREIPGFLDGIFPQLTAGLVAYLNRNRSFSCENIEAVPEEFVRGSSLQHAMLFEVAFARGEQLARGIANANWNNCLEVAVRRQRRHFDAKVPGSLTENDIAIGEWVGSNLAQMLSQLSERVAKTPLTFSPEIPGYQWIASGNGDFSLGSKLIEVKSSSRRFGSADYRQILMYWLLSYASAIEHGSSEWTHGVLLNPRLNLVIEVPFDYLIDVTTGGNSKVEVLEFFSALAGDYALKVLPEFRL